MSAVRATSIFGVPSVEIDSYSMSPLGGVALHGVRPVLCLLEALVPRFDDAVLARRVQGAPAVGGAGIEIAGKCGALVIETRRPRHDADIWYSSFYYAENLVSDSSTFWLLFGCIDSCHSAKFRTEYCSCLYIFSNIFVAVPSNISLPWEELSFVGCENVL